MLTSSMPRTMPAATCWVALSAVMPSWAEALSDWIALSFSRSDCQPTPFRSIDDSASMERCKATHDGELLDKAIRMRTWPTGFSPNVFRILETEPWTG